MIKENDNNQIVDPLGNHKYDPDNDLPLSFSSKNTQSITNTGTTPQQNNNGDGSQSLGNQPQPITPNQTPLPSYKPPTHNLAWDNINELIVYFLSVEGVQNPNPVSPPMQIAEFAVLRTKPLLKGLDNYLPTYDGYKYLYRMSFCHYIVTSRFWYPNPYFKKYGITQTGTQVIQSSADGSSSASAFMFKSIQNGDFLMNDLLQSPYGRYVYEVLEQMRHLIVTI